jgi:hypothetical protein
VTSTARARVTALGCALGLLALAACSGSDDGSEQTPPPPPPRSSGACGDFRIAYDPSNGYEASAFIVGEIAARALHCNVEYVTTTSRAAWQLIADGGADVYMDAYGSPDVRAELGVGEPTDGAPTTTPPSQPDVAVLGPNGVKGSVHLMAPAFMGDRGLESAQDLHDATRIGWGSTTPAITTSTELVRLAHSVDNALRLGYVVLNNAEISGHRGMRYLYPQPRQDDIHQEPNLYLVQGPRQLIGDGVGRHVVDLPESSANGCQPTPASTLCSLADFRYVKIANADFAESGSPAYSLVYHYELSDEDVATIEELVALSGYDVGAVDVASWINTHRAAWQAWLR